MDAVELCPFRRDVAGAGAAETATCGLLAAAFGAADDALARVGRAACVACRRASGPEDARTNSVLAALVYDRADRRLEERPPAPEADRLARLKADARCRLARPTDRVSRAPEALGVLTAGERRIAAAAPAAGRRLTWAVAVLTAPRRPPVLDATLASLSAAGFDAAHLFAEPGAAVPALPAGVTLTRHGRRQGQLRNFVSAAGALLDRHPAADCYAIFEDDITAALGLRQWCDGQLWPCGHGVVSLYTSRVFADDRPGWQTLNLGADRTFGAMAFVFRGAELRALLADPGVTGHVDRGAPAADAVVGEWALRRGVGIAYHTPSLVQHEGRVTAMPGHALGRLGRALAVAAVDDILGWRPPPPRMGRVGLVGWNAPTGLGYQNRDIAAHLPVARWLAPRHPWAGRLPRPTTPADYWSPWGRVSRRALRGWLDGLDWLLFVEKPYLPDIARTARQMGISVACVPNWEWLAPDLPWLPHVDLMLCPAAATARMLGRWRRDYGFAWDVAHVPWPIDPARFPFRCRERCRRFVFANGYGGTDAVRPDGARTPYRRKGAEVVAAAAELLPGVPFLIYSQDHRLPAMPANVEVRPSPADNADLYRDGDVCVQPSRWEGLGLQLLECQAAGLPVVTTDAPPMNECRPFRAVPAADVEAVFLVGDYPVDAHLVRPEDLAAALAAVYDTDLRDASHRARAYIERERSWPRVRDALAAHFPA